MGIHVDKIHKMKEDISKNDILEYSNLHKFSIILLGNSGIGKSWFRHKLIFNKLPETKGHTIGSDFSVLRKKIHATEMLIQIFDLSGKDEFIDERIKHHDSADVAVLMFSIDDTKSFEDIPIWLDELTENNNHKIIPMVIVGTKADSVNSRVVTKNEVSELVHEISSWSNQYIPYVEVSSVDSTGLSDFLENLFKLTTTEDNDKITL